MPEKHVSALASWLLTPRWAHLATAPQPPQKVQVPELNPAPQVGTLITGQTPQSASRSRSLSALLQPVPREPSPADVCGPRPFLLTRPPSSVCVLTLLNPSTETYGHAHRLHLIRFSLVPACPTLCGSGMCHWLVLLCFPARCQLQKKRTRSF